MPVLAPIAALAPEMTAWRRHLHRHPELGFDCHATAAFVAEKLRSFGVDELHEGIATSGVVALIAGRGDGPTIGLRADMDALPIAEETGLPWASAVPGRMHACGHDGHTAMLLGAARYLTSTRAFRGRVALIFQPAEEQGSGAAVMVRAGVLDRFGVGSVFALHNAPNRPLGHVATCGGPIMAAVDTFKVRLRGRGGHGAMPHETADPLIAGVAMVQALQTIVSRNHRATEELVLSVTQFHAGTADNVIPGEAWFGATVRTFRPEVRQMVRDRVAAIAEGTAAAFGVRSEVDWIEGDPATVNDPAEAAFAAAVAREIVGPERVDDAAGREMGAEDFAHMLAARPGAYLFLGQGEGPPVHHPAYDFNDAVAPIGASLFARLVERALPPA